MTTPTTPTASLAQPVRSIPGPRNLASLHRDVWTLFRRHPLVFLVVPAVIWFPVDLVTTALADLVPEGASGAGAVSRIERLLQGLVTPLVACFTTAAALRIGRREPVSPGIALNDALHVFGRAIVTSWLAGFLIILGTLFFIVPGLILATRYSMMFPVVLEEGLSGMAALRRSSELVKERGALAVFGYGMAGYLVYLLLGLAFLLVPVVVLALAEIDVPEMATVPFTVPLNLTMVGLALGTTLLYIEAREMKGLAWPVGEELADGDAGPRGTGVPGLAIAATAAALTVPVLALLVVEIVKNL